MCPAPDLGPFDIGSLLPFRESGWHAGSLGWVVLECEQERVIDKAFEINESAIALVEVDRGHALGFMPGIGLADMLSENRCATEEVEYHVELGTFLVDLARLV